jgi:hypothetical protein
MLSRETAEAFVGLVENGDYVGAIERAEFALLTAQPWVSADEQPAHSSSS